jgi:hypothetical protein
MAFENQFGDPAAVVAIVLICLVTHRISRLTRDYECD